jgi:signal peptidase I
VVVLGAVGFAAFSVLSGGWDAAPILSGSMSPGFPVGGVALAEREPVSQLALRDVVIFKNPYHPDVQMVHRIISLKMSKSGQPIIKTQGDANTAPDPWTVTMRGKTVYVVQYTLPLLGYPGVYTNHGLDLVVAGVILLLVVGGAVLSRDREDRSPPGGAGPGRTTEVWPEYEPVSTTVKARSGSGSTTEMRALIAEDGPGSWS